MREVLRREWLVASRSLGQLGQTLLFMLLVLTLFPLAISPERQVLEQVAALVGAVRAVRAGVARCPRAMATADTLELRIGAPQPRARVAQLTDVALGVHAALAFHALRVAMEKKEK